MLFIIGGIVLVMGIAAFLYSRQRGEFKLAAFLQSFGIDMSEGIESLIYGIRTIILLALEFVFAHLEAENLASVMPYREGAYLMGLALALVAMVAGMTFATEMNLQGDRRKNILPAIESLRISIDAKRQMLHTYNRTFKASRAMMWTSLLVAIGMHAAIVLMGLFSLWQHEKYAVEVMNGMPEIVGMPPLNYTVWFNMPLVVSSTMVGLMGFVIDVILGMTSNIVEELYKYKPNKEILKTTAELEAEFGEQKPKEKADKTKTDKTEASEDTSSKLEQLSDKFCDIVEVVEETIVLPLNYTGKEDTWKLIEDFMESAAESTLDMGDIDDIDITMLNKRYNNGTSTTKESYTKMVQKMYKSLLDKLNEVDTNIAVLEQGFQQMEVAMKNVDVKKAEEVLDAIGIAYNKYEEVLDDLSAEARKLISGLAKMPK